MVYLDKKKIPDYRMITGRLQDKTWTNTGIRIYNHKSMSYIILKTAIIYKKKNTKNFKQSYTFIPI
jgi:hypothetical protein